MGTAETASRDAGTLPFPRLPAGTPNAAMPFDHVVVVMMENHSFDNLLGSLALTRPEIDGLTFEHGDPTNANPGAAGMPGNVRAFELADTGQGSDVSQTWQDAHQQINGGRMDGFVRSTKSTQPMGYYTRTTLPFAYSLAEEFTVGNRWFCSLPGPTYPNRRFLLAGTAYGCTVTDSATLLEGPPPRGTIFDQLSKHGISWRNYFSDLPMTMMIPTSIIDHPLEHRPIEEFLAACREGTLPRVSFVDPRIGALSRIGKPIASLPGVFRELLSRIGADLSGADSAQTEEDPQDMYYGEQWAHQIVQAVLDSPQWARTLLIYIYDEHGGYYDHVSPPAAIEPDEIPPKLGPDDPPAQYNLYGPRVPAIVVSPYSKRGGVTNVVHDHTSVLATIEHKWNLPALTRRDANANTVMDFLDLAQAPNVHPRPLKGPSDTGPSGPVSKPPDPGSTAATPASRALAGALTTTSAPAQDAPRGPCMTTTTPTPSGDDSQRFTLTFWIAVVGIVTVLIAFLAALLAFHGSKNPGQTVPAVLAAVTAAIGTLAGLVAGHAAGSEGRAKAEQRASDNERDAAAGRALAHTMLAEAPQAAAGREDQRTLQATTATATQPGAADIARRHAALARALFPDA